MFGRLAGAKRQPYSSDIDKVATDNQQAFTEFTVQNPLTMAQVQSDSLFSECMHNTNTCRQKAAKQLAARNTTKLNQAHLISLGNNLFFLLMRLLVYRSTFKRNTLLLWVLLSFPAWVVELWLEKIGRPRYAENGELKKSGEDLEAKGLTDFIWDLMYWTWACIAAAATVGDKAWWMYAVVPVYSIWTAATTVMRMRKGMAGMAGQGDDNSQRTDASGDSKRQKKLEKRGGQKMQYR